MNKPKFTINVNVDNPEFTEDIPKLDKPCEGFLLIRFNGDDVAEVDIVHGSVHKIAMAMALSNTLQQAMAIAEGYIKAKQIKAEGDRFDFMANLLKGVEI